MIAVTEEKEEEKAMTTEEETGTVLVWEINQRRRNPFILFIRLILLPRTVYGPLILGYISGEGLVQEMSRMIPPTPFPTHEEEGIVRPSEIIEEERRARREGPVLHLRPPGEVGDTLFLRFVSLIKGLPGRD